uniref:Enkurin domain-containing protein n=1 Tax=Oreochromis niloticus TaxID=8128 RepID=A0A669EZ43_ORENI
MSEFMFSEESAYNLLPKESNPPPKQKMYTSKYREAVVLENKQHKHKHRTMGPGTPKAPSHREMCPQRPEGEKPEHTCRKKTENTGIKKVMPQPACVDTRKGDKQLLEKSGLVPFYLKKKDYGNVPEASGTLLLSLHTFTMVYYLNFKKNGEFPHTTKESPSTTSGMRITV